MVDAKLQLDSSQLWTADQASICEKAHCHDTFVYFCLLFLPSSIHILHSSTFSAFFILTDFRRCLNSSGDAISENKFNIHHFFYIKGCNQHDLYKWSRHPGLFHPRWEWMSFPLSLELLFLAHTQELMSHLHWPLIIARVRESLSLIETYSLR